jgi:hypothetical protein
VASQAAIYVEDKVRRWAGDPKDAAGRRLLPAALVAQALGEQGVLSLGQQANEAKGWHQLGLGFVSALGNVDRHNIQDRADLRLYALGVLGVASLLLTQIKFQHPDVVAEREKKAR